MTQKIIQFPVKGASEIKKALLFFISKLDEDNIQSLLFTATLKSDKDQWHTIISDSGDYLEKLGLISALEEQIKIESKIK